MSVAGKIAKNTTYLSVSSILQKVLAFGFYIYTASQLGEDLLGRYAFALSYTGIFVIIMNFGFVPVLTREGAKDQQSIQKHLELILALKLVLAVIALVVMFAVFHGLNQLSDVPTYTVQLVYLAGIVIVLDTFRSVFLAVLRAMQKMQYEAIGQIIYQIIVVAGGSLVLFLGYKAQALVGIIILASAVYFIYSLYAVIHKAGIRPKIHWLPSQFWHLTKVAAPFALADIFFKLNGSIDTVMLEYLAGDRFVAWYNIALKLTVTLTIIPGAFATAMFPAMSRAFVESKDTLRTIFERSTEYLIVISVPIAAGTYVLAPKIINLAFPDFPASIQALQIFMASVVFLFINYPIGNLLNAANRQTTNTANMAIALLLNIVLNIYLIPHHTFIGAALSSVISTIVLVALGLPRVYAIVPFSIRSIVMRFIRTVIAAVSMGAILMVLPDWPFFVVLAIGVVSYMVILYIVRGITTAECKELVRSVMAKL